MFDLPEILRTIILLLVYKKCVYAYIFLFFFDNLLTRFVLVVLMPCLDVEIF
jgi:hypothetical protein